MDVIDSIIAAIVAGCISSGKETASLAIKDAYTSLKNLILARIPALNFRAPLFISE